MTQAGEPKKIPVGISSCLVGERVRYNGNHKHQPLLIKSLDQYFEFLPFCPEVDIGLGTPRNPVQLVAQDGKIRCVNTLDPMIDITDRLIDCAKQQLPWHKNICAYIFKKNSPSCGPDRVKVLDDGKVIYRGIGVYAERLMQSFPHLPVADEYQLSEQKFKTNFVQWVFIYQRWQYLLDNHLSWETLLTFHEHHQAILISRNQILADELYNQLTETIDLSMKGSTGKGLDIFQQIYIDKLSAILKIMPQSEIKLDLSPL